MPILLLDLITSADVRTRPYWLYVIDDNLERRTPTGYSAPLKGAPNTIGIPTSKGPDKPLSDDDFDQWLLRAGRAFNRIEFAIRYRKTVVFPKPGLGSGPEKLQTAAPRIFKALAVMVSDLGILEGRLQRDAVTYVGRAEARKGR